ncbi:MAG TPA: PIN domain-containing protein [Chitinophagaceae bacterium]|nr:PIN domain-containing protein [Chitinophagaceae bacterium]
MKVLLDTNIIIHREASLLSKKDIGILFLWLDKLKYEKLIHPVTVQELAKLKNNKTAETMAGKIASYILIRNPSPLFPDLAVLSQKIDSNENDKNDTLILNEVANERVDILITEDKKIHEKAARLGVSDKVFKIDQFLEKVTAENPSLVDYKVLAVKKADFAHIPIQDEFFDSFHEDYPGFDKWFAKKADEIAYVCYDDNNQLAAFLYIKVEGPEENYTDITPVFSRKKRLKIGTFKVIANGFRIGERFLKIIFDNALQYRVDEIYVTIFDKRPEQTRLIDLLQLWGFKNHGIKSGSGDSETVYVKDFDRNQLVNLANPKLSFPFISKESKVFIVPIYPDYHTELFPDSILRTESPMDFVENQPHRNALSKVYISRSVERTLSPGDIIVFYRTGGYHKSVASTYGIVESVIDNIPDEEAFIRLCKKRSVFTDQELSDHWNDKTIKPFIVNFIYAHSFRKKPNLAWLIDNGVIADVNSAPRGFTEISRENFTKIAEYSVGK